MKGYMHKILRVDLTNGKITEEVPEDKVLKDYLGGAGLATKYLLEEVKKGTDPLGPDNKLIFMTGPLTGTASTSAGRYDVVAKSPLTGLWGHANSGGYWAKDFKRSGFDGIIFEGKSPKPVYLVTNEGKAELKDASHLWGKGVFETTRLIKEELGNEFNVACIGIAGENLVKYAAIINDLHRAAGRCGMGTVMGSKNLKAIAAKGTAKIEIANADEFREVTKKCRDLVNESFVKMAFETYGTAGMVDIIIEQGGYPTRNWQTGVFPNIDNINGVAIVDKILVDRKACFACPIRCGRGVEVKMGPYACKGEGPEYESVGALGAMCDIDNLDAITKAHILCNDLGLDTISAGATIAFAMECFEKGILTKAETDGIAIRFGNPKVMVELVNKIAKREGIGDLLAEGTRIMSEKLGKESEKFAIHVKGLELAAYDPRAAKITGLSYVTANRGGCHMTAYVQGPTFLQMPFPIIKDSEIGDVLVENPEEAKIVKDLEDVFAVFDAVGICKFIGLVLPTDLWARMIETATGEKFDEDHFRKTGERIYNLQRIFNTREGLTRADDTLPHRLLKEPLPEGPAEGQVVNLEPLLDAYYGIRGWDKNTGHVTPEKIKELGLDFYLD
ncbi:MAG: aldehyde ferredoxin oxidoreductase family protein [Candidatus Hodarchaeota archaeon]